MSEVEWCKKLKYFFCYCSVNTKKDSFFLKIVESICIALQVLQAQS